MAYKQRRIPNLCVKFRAKIFTIVYKADILYVFLFIMFFGIFFHYLTWIYEPPNLMQRDISEEEGKRLIHEWMLERQKQNSSYDGAVVDHVIAKDGDLKASHIKRDDKHANPLSKLSLIEKGMKSNISLERQEKLQMYDNIRALLRQDKDLSEMKDNENTMSKRDRAKVNFILKNNDTSFINRWKTKQNQSSDTHLSKHLDFNMLHASNHSAIKGTNSFSKPKIMEDFNHETKQLSHMDPKERENWLDEQAAEIVNYLFNKKPKSKNVDRKMYVDNVGYEHLFEKQQECTVYDVRVQINETYECMPLDVKPVVNVCLYPTHLDVHISKHIREEGIWEPHIVKEFQNILFTNPDYGFIDIGANIGCYSLIAARMGHQVVAVEPFQDNIKHFHQAVQIGGLAEKITLLRNAIFSERRRDMSLRLYETNQGGVALDPQRSDPCLTQQCPHRVKSILMDDLLEVINFRHAVMKIDIEGFEHRAFIHSDRLFNEVFISHIIMEWIKLRAYYGSEVDESEDKDLTHALVESLFGRGFRPFSLVTGIELKRQYWYAWPDDIIWKSDLDFARA